MGANHWTFISIHLHFPPPPLSSKQHWLGLIWREARSETRGFCRLLDALYFGSIAHLPGQAVPM
jgi:hypothetical protein